MLTKAGTVGPLTFETSLDGNNWTTRWTLSTTSDIPSTTISNVDLSALNGQNFKIRFRHNGQNANIYHWFIDDIAITGKQASNAAVTYTWISSPEGFVSNSNTPGSVTPSSTTTTYTMTATSNGCSVSAPVTVTLNQPNTSINVSGISIDNGDFIWNGNNSNNALSTTNWYQRTAGSYIVANSLPTSTSRVFVVPTAVGGSCISTTNMPVISSGSSNAKDFVIASGSTFNLGSATLTLAGNLFNNGTLNTGTGTILFNGNVAQTIDGSGNLSFYGLTINNSSGLTLLKNIEVSNTLTLTNGHIRLGSNHLTLGTSISSIGGTLSSNNMIVASGTGELRKRFSATGTFLFPIGTTNNGNEYSPVSLTFVSGTFNAGAYVSSRVVNARTTLMNNAIDTYINRNWILEPYNINGFLYNIILDYLPGDLKIGKYSASDIVPVKVSSGQWYQPDAISTAFTNTIVQGIHNPLANGVLQWDGLSTFSEFGGAAGSNQPLPVELLTFKGNCDDDSVKLEWQTSSEHNSSFFDIEKSRDGLSWQIINQVAAAGNSNDILTYTISDLSLTQDESYYRLNQVDIDGKSKIYGPIRVNCQNSEKSYISTFPNPSNSNFNVVVNNLSYTGSSSLSISDSRGILIFNKPVEIKKGINLFVIDEDLHPGIYFITISNGTHSTEVVKHLVK